MTDPRTPTSDPQDPRHSHQSFAARDACAECRAYMAKRWPTSDPDRPEPQTEAGRKLVAEFGVGQFGRLERHAVAIEAEARQQARAAFAAQVAALREALERIAVGCEASEWANDAVNVWDACMDPNYIEGEPTVRCSGCEAHFALLAASPEPASPGSGLDVERLARALDNLPPLPYGALNEKFIREAIHLPTAKEWATYIAAEYDRLAARPDGAEADAS